MLLHDELLFIERIQLMSSWQWWICLWNDLFLWFVLQVNLKLLFLILYWFNHRVGKVKIWIETGYQRKLFILSDLQFGDSWGRFIAFCWQWSVGIYKLYMSDCHDAFCIKVIHLLEHLIVFIDDVHDFKKCLSFDWILFIWFLWYLMFLFLLGF